MLVFKDPQQKQAKAQFDVVNSAKAAHDSLFPVFLPFFRRDPDSGQVFSKRVGHEAQQTISFTIHGIC